MRGRAEACSAAKPEVSSSDSSEFDVPESYQLRWVPGLRLGKVKLAGL